MRFREQPERLFYQLISAPFIYFMIIPTVFFDISMEVYHRICFRLYDIPYVSRSRYIIIDRHKLRKLSWIEKINCCYCGYVNGLLAYAVQVAGETEKYWCAIKHQKDPNFVEPAHHKDFASYEVYE